MKKILLISAIILILIGILLIILKYINNRENVGDFLKKINSVLKINYETGYGVKCTPEIKTVLNYLSYTGTPLYKTGVEKFLTDKTLYYGTGREKQDKEYVIGRLEMWRNINSYNTDIIVSISQYNNTVYIIRKNVSSFGRQTLYQFDVNPETQKIEKYYKLIDYLLGAEKTGETGEISMRLIDNVVEKSIGKKYKI